MGLIFKLRDLPTQAFSAMTDSLTSSLTDSLLDNLIDNGTERVWLGSPSETWRMMKVQDMISDE